MLEQTLTWTFPGHGKSLIIENNKVAGVVTSLGIEIKLRLLF